MALTTDTATDVLVQLHGQLGDFDPDTRAVVALSAGADDQVELTDVDLADNGVLRVDDAVDGLVVVTGDTLAPAEDAPADEEPVAVRQLVAVLRSGEEIGVFRLGDDDAVYRWSTAEPDDDLAALRPTDAAANSARRAFALPSHTGPVPVTELLARLWLLHLAQVTLERFDANDAVPVSVEQVAGADTRGPFAAILDDPAYADDEIAACRQLAGNLAWEDVRQLAVRGEFEVGPYTFDPEHADWLDADGFAQYFDDTVMSSGEILSSLDVMSGPELVAWAVDQLVRRDWAAPSVEEAAGRPA